ncbi:MAG: hypothetical protein M0P13_08370 [Fibrobacteraceae bacterium]|nr:hypothetical protein [Fibrobacteraceae bacterium]
MWKALFLMLLPLLAFAGEGTSSFSPWSSYGLELGSVMPVNDSWNEETSAFLYGNFIANFQVLPMMSVTGDAGYAFPGNGFNVKIGLEQQLLSTDFSPFVGGMAGLDIVPDDDHVSKFSDRVGPILEANAGLLFFRNSYFSFRLKGSYQWTFDKELDHGWGVSLGVLFANSRPGLKAIDVSK